MKNLLSSLLIYMTVPLLLLCGLQGYQALAWQKPDTDTAIAHLLYRESPQDSEMEMLKAQAVLLRSTLCLYTAQEWTALLQDSTSIEQEKKYIEMKDAYMEAVRETKPLVLKYKGNIMRGVYHEVSAGATRDGESLGLAAYEQLTSVDSSWDKQAEGYRQVFSFSEISLKRRFFREQEAPKIRVVSTDKNGYACTVQWGDTYVGGDYVRDCLALSSSCFTVEYRDGQWIFVCRGVGHGMGMSLYGANMLAAQGKTYTEILTYYFPNYEILPE